jgi:hypothetical protein
MNYRAAGVPDGRTLYQRDRGYSNPRLARDTQVPSPTTK